MMMARGRRTDQSDCLASLNIEGNPVQHSIARTGGIVKVNVSKADLTENLGRQPGA
jgi:hypothetical protein